MYSFIKNILKTKIPYYCFSALNESIKINRNNFKGTNSLNKKYSELVFKICLSFDITNLILISEKKSIVPQYLEIFNSLNLYIYDSINSINSILGVDFIIIENIEVKKFESILTVLSNIKNKVIVLLSIRQNDIRKVVLNEIYCRKYSISSVEINNAIICFFNYNITIEHVKVYF